jgi:hypothetical protein
LRSFQVGRPCARWWTRDAATVRSEKGGASCNNNVASPVSRVLIRRHRVTEWMNEVVTGAHLFGPPRTQAICPSQTRQKQASSFPSSPRSRRNTDVKLLDRRRANPALPSRRWAKHPLLPEFVSACADTVNTPSGFPCWK